MNKKTISKIFSAFKIIISLVLVICATISMLGATLINVGRNYINSEEFKTQVNTTDLSEVKFIVESEKTTVGNYMKDSAREYIESKSKYFFSFAQTAVDQLLSSEFVNRVVKNEVLYLVDFFINSDSKEAQKRLDNNIPIDTVLELDPKNAKSVEDAVRIFMRSFVVSSIEKTSQMSSDKFIVFLSQETVTKLVILSVVLLIALVAINYKSILNVLIYGGFSSLLCGIIINTAQNKFDAMNIGNEDLVGYVFLKPLADAYSTNATIGFIAGFILIGLFIASLFLLSPKTENQEETI